MSRIYRFGAFRLDASVWSLAVDGQPVILGARAVQLLCALVGRANEFVAKAELLDAAWPGRVVEEANLSVQISAIRRVLVAYADDAMRIETLSRRGYRFVGAVVVEDWASAVSLASPATMLQIVGERDAFVGRTKELSALAERLRCGARLITLTGAGGSGKTRLARRYARTSLGDWAGGVYFCDLSDVMSADGVIHAVSRALDIPLSGADPATQVAHAIAGRGHCLMILDNFEQVVQAAPIVGAWLDLTTNAAFVVTSRERLRLAGEDVFAVEPLPIEDDAVELFIVRANAQQLNWTPSAIDRQTVTELVRLLDGLPLAIELAAARSRVLTVSQIVERLRDRFQLLRSPTRTVARQATLKAAIDWSWQLLAPWEQEALGQACAFDGGFTMTGAEAVLDVSEWPEAPSVLDIVQALLDKSLLRQIGLSISGEERFGELRFGMYLSIREYAQARRKERDANAEDTVLRRHGRYFATFGADSAIEALYRYGGVQRRQALAQEIDNLTAACQRAVAQGEAATAAGVFCAAWEVFAMRGPFALGISLGTQVASLSSIPDPWFAAAMTAFATAYRRSHRLTEAEMLYARALAKSQDTGDRIRECAARRQLAVLYREQNRHDDAVREFHAAIALAQILGRRREEGGAIGLLGDVFFYDLYRYDEARRHFAAALSIAREVGNRVDEAVLTAKLGLLEKSQGNPASAHEQLTDALAMARENGDRWLEAGVLTGLGQLLSEGGTASAARERYQAALAIYRDIGDRSSQPLVLNSIGSTRSDDEDPTGARRDHEQALQVAIAMGDQENEAWTRHYLGVLDLAQGRMDEARAHLDLAAAQSAGVGDRLTQAVLCGDRAELLRRNGRLGDAMKELVWGEQVLRDIGDPRPVAEILCIRCRIELDLGQVIAARLTLTETESITTALGLSAGSLLAREMERLRNEICGRAVQL